MVRCSRQILPHLRRKHTTMLTHHAPSLHSSYFFHLIMNMWHRRIYSNTHWCMTYPWSDIFFNWFIYICSYEPLWNKFYQPHTSITGIFILTIQIYHFTIWYLIRCNCNPYLVVFYSFIYSSAFCWFFDFPFRLNIISRTRLFLLPFSSPPFLFQIIHPFLRSSSLLLTLPISSSPSPIPPHPILLGLPSVDQQQVDRSEAIGAPARPSAASGTCQAAEQREVETGFRRQG